MFEFGTSHKQNLISIKRFGGADFMVPQKPKPLIRRAQSRSERVTFGSQAGDHSKEGVPPPLYSTAAELENLPRIAPEQTLKDWHSLSPHMALGMGRFLTWMEIGGERYLDQG